MLKLKSIILVASAVAFTVAYLPSATNSFAISCDDVKFIFARGSGQKINDREYSTFKTDISLKLKAKTSNLRYSFYELGSKDQNGAKYPAISVDKFTTILSAKISAGTSFAYGDSINEGITELENYVASISNTCKNTKFILAGYSQGAQVMTMAIPYLDPNKVIYVATFGDPKLYLPEGKGLNPDACLGKNLSPYREFAPNCHTYAGLLDAKKPYQPSDWFGKIGLWCKDKDIICGAGLELSTSGDNNNFLENLTNNIIHGHVTYVEDGVISSAANTIAKKLQKTFPKKFSTASIANAKNPNQDTIILIDKTNSMAPYINEYKSEALHLAKEILSSGGRIALFTYGDGFLGEKPQMIANFGCNFSTFSNALNSVAPSGGGDIPESVLSASLFAMNNVAWRDNVKKSIITLTDSGYHDPDYDGTTLNDVIKRSLEIDPVNIYVLNKSSLAETDYNMLTTKSSGKIFTTLDSTSTEYLLTRPDISLPLSEYIGIPGQTFSFEAITEGDIVSYEWDLDFDGNFETTTSTPQVNKTYTSPQTGYIQVRIRDVAGNSSTASAKVTVSSSIQTLPVISNLDVSINDTNAAISFNSTGTATTVSIGDAFYGITTETNLEISDIKTYTTLTLTPISKTGLLGEPVTTTLTPSTNQLIETGHSLQSDPTIPLTPNSGKR